MRKVLGTITGKSVKLALKHRRGGGQALPGLVVESLFPKYLQTMLAQLPEGVVLITGTNGKTTTTKIVTQILTSQGKKVLTNQTGSNLTRGIVSSLSQNASLAGKLDFDLAVLEVDEAQAKRLVSQIKPRWVLALNVSRDQLDRYGEVDTIAGHVAVAMGAATEGIITNAGDPSLLKRAQAAAAENGLALSLFGTAANLSKFFPTDYEIAAVNRSVKSREKLANMTLDVELAAFKNSRVTYLIDGKRYVTQLKLTGQHNYLNGAAALVLCRKLLPDAPIVDLINELSKVTLAFGRGEKYRFDNGAVVELVLVKNPASFTQALLSYSGTDTGIMIAINDNIADGRDVSWLWDVNFGPLKGRMVSMTSGTRAADMALRLSYDDIRTGEVEPSLPRALSQITLQPGPKVVLATYTAMLKLYGLLSKQAEKIQ